VNADGARRPAATEPECPDADIVRLLALRDAGVSEVLIGPVTFARVEERLRAMARDRREFVDSPGYVGPDRRLRRDVFLPPGRERRARAPAARSGSGQEPADGRARTAG